MSTRRACVDETAGAAGAGARAGAARGGAAGAGSAAEATSPGLATAGGGGVAAIGFGEGCKGTTCACASEAPQKRQNCAAWSDAPRQRGHRRCIAGAAVWTTSTTRTGAIGDGPTGGAGETAKDGGGSGTVRSSSVFTGGSAGPRAATGAAAGPGVSRCPQVTQKRRPFWFALPQSGQAIMATVPPAARSTPPRGAKLTCGAGGRCRLAGSRSDGGAAIGGICGAPCIGGGGGVEGARAVAASGEASPIAIDPGGASPMGGVGGAMRGASRCPHSWQKVRWLGLSRPHVV